LIQRFGRQETAVLELKTKTSEMAPFREAASVHNRKTIAAWSLNPPEIIRETERGTAPLTARLEAAAACEAMGYPLAFHFDPMFLFTGCEAAYRNLVRRLFAYVSPENIVWISMGTFRFMPEMKPIIEKRFPRTNIPYGEFITGIDGKMRYFKPLRIRLYQAFAEAVRSFAPDVALYLCMEDQTVWQRALGASPDSSEAVAKILDEGAVRRCGLVPRTA
jgi:spore photoproduct lyase